MEFKFLHEQVWDFTPIVILAQMKMPKCVSFVSQVRKTCVSPAGVGGGSLKAFPNLTHLVYQGFVLFIYFFIRREKLTEDRGWVNC